MLSEAMSEGANKKEEKENIAGEWEADSLSTREGV